MMTAIMVQVACCSLLFGGPTMVRDGQPAKELFKEHPEYFAMASYGKGTMK